jgi:ATP-dependent helicase HrpA
VPALLDDCLTGALDGLMAAHRGPVRDRTAFGRLREAVRADLPETVLDVVRQVAGILTTAREIENQVSGATSPALLPALVDVRAQLSGLVYPGFVTAAGHRRLPDLHRYLRAIERRLDNLGSRPERDRALMSQVRTMQDEHERWVASLPPSRRSDAAVLDVRWMLEELRVSLFAQTVGTPAPVSDKRIRRAMAQAG